MRTIKFRVWNKTIYPEMLKSDVIDFRNTGWIMMTEETNGGIDQFTGLLDSKGKEIYEGDIVEGNTEVYEKGGYRSKEKERAKVEITPDGVRLNRREYKRYSRIEVIGNIYQNPELLK